MDEDLRDRVKKAAEADALFNALKHDSDAKVGAIMGPLMGENAEFREYGDAIPGIIAPVVERVNDLSREEQRERLFEVAPGRLAELETEDEGEQHPLPELPNVEEYPEVRMRVAPNPNGPWHIGHARMAAVVGTYKDRYDGYFVCRFDDTDPETKRPDLDAYDEILDAIEYLGFRPNRELKASDRLETYYAYARDLIDLGGAYTCSCPAELFSELKNDAESCPHREKDRQTIRDEFQAMIDGLYDPGEMVLRIKTDIEHKNPALRDWVAFRMIDTPHPRQTADDYRCWPMLDFQSGIDDHLTGITHIIRGIDLQDSAKRQQFVYDDFNWEYPEVIHWGHVQIDAYDVPMSTSTIAELIDTGELDGWDDPRAPTIASLRRRGIQGEAIVEAMVELGTSTSNVDLSLSSIYANNRETIDDEADRRFFVRDGVEMALSGGPEHGQPPIHPDHEERGQRHISIGSAVLVEDEDIPPMDERVWLKGFGCVRRDEDRQFTYTDDTIEVVRERDVDVIHWVPATTSVPIRLRTMEGDVTGRVEPGVLSYEPDDIVQFERVGFARFDAVPETTDPAALSKEEELVAYFAHP